MRASELSASEVCSVAAVSALSARHFYADLTLPTVSGHGQAARSIRLQRLASLRLQMRKRHASASLRRGPDCVCCTSAAFAERQGAAAGEALRSEGLLHAGIWEQLRAVKPQASDSRLLAFLKLTATGAGYRHAAAYADKNGPNSTMPGHTLYAPCQMSCQVS